MCEIDVMGNGGELSYLARFSQLWSGDKGGNAFPYE